MYDNTALSTRATILAALATVSNVIFSFLCWLAYPRQDLGGGEGGRGEEKEAALSEREESEEGSGDARAEVLQTSVIARMESHSSRSELLDEAGSNRRLSQISTTL